MDGDVCMCIPCTDTHDLGWLVKSSLVALKDSACRLVVLHSSMQVFLVLVVCVWNGAVFWRLTREVDRSIEVPWLVLLLLQLNSIRLPIYGWASLERAGENRNGGGCLLVCLSIDAFYLFPLLSSVSRFEI